MHRFVHTAPALARKWMHSSEACIGGISVIAASTLMMATALQRDNNTHDKSKDTCASMLSSNAQYLKDHLKLFNRTSQLCQCEALAPDSIPNPGFALRRRRTENVLKTLASQLSFSNQFRVLPTPLSDDELGTVFLAIDRLSKEKAVLKLIPKDRLDDISFLQELEALLRIRQSGGHLHICGLQQNFDNDQNNYELIFDFVGGGSLFDRLQKKAYSEEDVASKIRAVVSALDFLHSIRIVHSNLTPESLMLSSPDDNAVVKLVDCGRAKVISYDENHDWGFELSTNAFSPPEAFTMGSNDSLKPSMDMWSLGIILYILLTGEHPFHLHDEATDEVLMRRIQGKVPVPLSGFDHTAHLSSSALDLLGKFLTTDPEKRITAKDALNHPWIKGETASNTPITGLNLRLAQYQELDSKLISSGLSLCLDDIADLDGYAESPQHDDPFSEISPIVLENMESRLYPAGDVVIKEGELGSSMFLIKHGSVKIESKDGFTARLGEGDTFGEGSLLHPDKVRSATVTCATPVEVIEISREFANKFLASTNTNFGVLLKEMDSTRGVGRARSIIGQHEQYNEFELKRSQCLFRKGDEGDAVYLLEHGKIDIIGQGGVVFCLGSGDMFGEESLLLEKPRNSSAICTADVCKLKSISAENFHALLKSSPASRDAIHDLAVKRDFERALALKMKKERRTLSNIEAAFDTIDKKGTHVIALKEAHDMLGNLDTALSEEEITDALHTLDPTDLGTVDLEEFKRIFVKSRVHDYPLQRRSRSRPSR